MFDLKLLRTLLVTGVNLILFHEVISHWGTFMAGVRDGYKQGSSGH